MVYLYHKICCWMLVCTSLRSGQRPHQERASYTCRYEDPSSPVLLPRVLNSNDLNWVNAGLLFLQCEVRYGWV
ncbi:MAG: hypothetical protein NXY57DRAFT_276139 [Lentinula lateritia]|nr:MAG: hypothetical protein NXY57DRAFT_276139 [Lentinula lateritia]